MDVFIIVFPQDEGSKAFLYRAAVRYGNTVQILGERSPRIYDKEIVCFFNEEEAHYFLTFVNGSCWTVVNGWTGGSYGCASFNASKTTVLDALRREKDFFLTEEEAIKMAEVMQSSASRNWHKFLQG